MLDDSSQSSFKYHQSSGSLNPLPFHDSAHTMYEPYQMHSSEYSSANESGRDGSQNESGVYAASTGSVYSSKKHAVASVPTSSRVPEANMFNVNAQYARHFPNTSIFLENSDILDDKEYPKLYHRHSTIMAEHGDGDQDTERRYSDTRLQHASNSDGDSLTSDDNENVQVSQPIFNVANVLGTVIPPAYTQVNAVPQTTDIIFDNTSPGGTFDPLKLQEQEAINARHRAIPRHSMHDVALRQAQPTAAATRNVFKSMPNLSGSSENLLQKQWRRPTDAEDGSQ